jgi:hypothetical protein
MKFAEFLKFVSQLLLLVAVLVAFAMFVIWINN